MYKKNAKWLIFGILAVIILAMISSSLGKYKENVNTTVTLNIRKPAYTVRFHPNNGGADSYVDQVFAYGTAQHLTINSFTNGNLIFFNWATAADGTGTTYSDEEEVNNLTQIDGTIIDLYAQWGEELYQAEVVGDKKYSTVAEAITAASANNSQHTIKLLKNVEISSALNIAQGKNIIFDLQNFTISNVSGTDICIFSSKGRLEIIGGANGTIQSSASHAAIDNNTATATLIVRSGRIIATGERQAIYNSGGTVEVTGSAYLSSSASDRPAIQNVKPSNTNAGTVTISGGTILSTNTTTKGAIENDNTGTVIITGGTITSENLMGVNNKGTLVIGEEGGDIDITSPVIQGATYGVNSTTSTVEFYDGIVKGIIHAFNNENNISDMENNCSIDHSSEVISGDTYETAYLVTSDIRLDFNGNGGAPAQTIVFIPPNTAIGANLPSAPTRAGHQFDGWFTDPTNGTQITSATVVSANDTYYAHWTKVKAVVIFEAGEGGTSSESTREVNIGAQIGELPTATKQYKTFVGWFTDPSLNGTQITTSQVINDDVTYYAHWDPIIATVTLNPEGGTIPATTGWTIDPQDGTASKTVEAGNTVGTLPTPTKADHDFMGWYTAALGGTSINSTEMISGTVTYHAQWVGTGIAQIGSTKYATLQAAVDAVPDNTQTTITLLDDSLEGAYISSSKNIILDLDGHTLYNDGTARVKSMNDNTTRESVIENLGTLKIMNGTIHASSKQSAINTSGNITIENATVKHTGTGANTKQAIYLYTGTLTVTGNSNISANNAGTYQNVNRGVIQTDAGTVRILGGTVKSESGPAITGKAAGTIELGEKDGSIDATSPVIQGKTYGVEPKGTFNFYDGIVKGRSGATNGTVSDTETGATRVDGTETIGSYTYNTVCYQ